MNIKKTAIGMGAVIIAGLALVWVLNKGGLTEEESLSDLPVATEPVAGNRLDQPAEPVPSSSKARELDGSKKVYVVKSDGKAGGTKSAGMAAEESLGNNAATERAEQAVRRWDALVDAVAERKDAPDRAQGERIKKAFEELDPRDKLPAINQALNLIPDEQFATLYPILYDKEQPEEVLDAIFNDALNRDETIKIPLMKELRKDKTHPMFFESARILDVIEK